MAVNGRSGDQRPRELVSERSRESKRRVVVRTSLYKVSRTLRWVLKLMEKSKNCLLNEESLEAHSHLGLSSGLSASSVRL